ncbi:hypothetical protein IscW_ISCW006149 [Ixodes scapularis]|uniref:Uncharacterized protein n=1 Tax=Ixodes scapularis TaxID=6945 RepID=B7PMV1_IXOSC|nr:hypothetical protein IscW_ISCW006149 [Ixodes scapularis]|eukprot:XP_002435099.1 hypothetical protein IscW_ISCW006149 [Ixodes scapularis]
MVRPVPVYVVEPHHHALHHIYRAIGRKKLPFSKVLMVHFDAHPDLVLPPGLDPARCRDRDHVLDVVDIESWILPAALAGHLDRVLWVRSPWSDQLPDGDQQFLIGSRDGQVWMTCPLPYFLSECIWTHQVDEGHELGLRVQTLDALLEAKPNDGGNAWQPEDRCFVLDIDLDFYSTQDPFAMVLSQSQMQLLRQLYHASFPDPTADPGLLEEAQAKRRAQLQHLKEQLQRHLPTAESSNRGSSIETLNGLCHEVGPINNPEATSGVDLQADSGDSVKVCALGKPVDRDTDSGVDLRDDTVNSPVADAKVDPRLLDLCNDLTIRPPKGEPLEAKLIHDAGCTCDMDSQLPHHVSSRDEILALIGSTTRFLGRLNAKPALITIARSSLDGYCPPSDVDFVQEKVLDALRELYGELDVSLDYDEPSAPGNLE